MVLTIIVGSSRENSQSQKVANFIAKQVNINKKYNKVEIISLQKINLELWTENNFSDNPNWSHVSKILKSSSAFIVISPEWDGMACPALKNFFNYCRNLELFHKPALLVSVSAGHGGSYPIAELRMSSYKNSRICYLPEQVIVRHAEEVLNHECSVNDNDQLIRDRIDYAAEILFCYAVAFKNILNKKFLYNQAFQNGM